MFLKKYKDFVKNLASIISVSNKTVHTIAMQNDLESWDYRVDVETPRIDCVRRLARPIIFPGGRPWMQKTVFDGRPVKFNGLDLVYFCAQPFYRNDSQIVIGRAVRDQDEWVVDEDPVLFPDMERNGINIPTFLVQGDRLYCAYFDNYGPNRKSSSQDADLIIAVSTDGVYFEKQRLSAPLRGLAGQEFKIIGLPWMMKDGDQVMMYFSARSWSGEGFVGRSRLDLSRSEISDFTLSPVDREIINVAVMKKDGFYTLFYGCSYAGGFYTQVSRDGANWIKESKTMIYDGSKSNWGWDFYKVCPSPLDSGGECVELCYLAGPWSRLSVGYATLDWKEFSEKMRGFLSKNPVPC